VTLMSDTCPVCNREGTVEDDSFVAVRGRAYQDCKCTACEARWTNVFLLLYQENVCWFCEGCRETHEQGRFAGHRVCRACGARICDDWHGENGPWCLEHETAAAKEKALFAERADYEYERARDSG